MNTIAVKTKAVNLAKKVGFKLEKNSPQLFLVGGIVGGVGAAVLACMATLKAPAIVEEAREDLQVIRDVAEREDLKEKYPEEVISQTTVQIYVRMALKLAKVYAPAVGLGVLSIVSICTAHGKMKKRNVALTTAYTALNKEFGAYRDRVIDRYGEDVERAIRYDLKEEEIVEETVDPETGKKKKTKKKVIVADPDNMPSQFARFFDEASRHWKKNPEYNLDFLRGQQQYANDLLVARGHMYLNDIYEMLDFPASEIGHDYGWVYDPTNPDLQNYIDFNLYDLYNKAKRDFVDGYEPNILLDFQPDGDIRHLLY